jgi:GxxExxY protein
LQDERILIRPSRKSESKLTMTNLLHKELTHTIIGALYDVHNGLGPGFIYRIYANAIYYELQLRGLEPKPHHIYQVIYRQQPVGAIKFKHVQINDRLMVFNEAVFAAV